MSHKIILKEQAKLLIRCFSLWKYLIYRCGDKVFFLGDINYQRKINLIATDVKSIIKIHQGLIFLQIINDCLFMYEARSVSQFVDWQNSSMNDEYVPIFLVESYPLPIFINNTDLFWTRILV